MEEIDNCCEWHFDLVIYHPISSKLHNIIWTVLPLVKSEYGFCLKEVAKMDIRFHCRAFCGALCRSLTVLVPNVSLCDHFAERHILPRGATQNFLCQQIKFRLRNSFTLQKDKLQKV